MHNESLHSDSYPDFKPPNLFFNPQWCVLGREAANTSFIIFALTRPGLEPTIYRTRVKHANHYTTDAVSFTFVTRNILSYPHYSTTFFNYLYMLHSLQSYAHGYVKLDENTSQSFPLSWPITGFVIRLTRRVPLVEQELPTLPEHLSSPPVFFSGVRITLSLVLCVCFVDCCLSFRTFLGIVFSVLLRFMDSDYPFGIFKLCLHSYCRETISFCWFYFKGA